MENYKNISQIENTNEKLFNRKNDLKKRGVNQGTSTKSCKFSISSIIGENEQSNNNNDVQEDDEDELTTTTTTSSTATPDCVNISF